MTKPSQFASENQDIRPEAQDQNAKPFPRQSPYRAILLALVAALAIFVVSVGADMLLIHDHEPARFTVEVSDAISSLVIGLLSYRLFRLQDQKREYVRHKLEIIADMNHHVRNALQVISLTTYGNDKEEIGAIRESVNRIQWALRELLPKI
jgi:hypothetical protein